MSKASYHIARGGKQLCVVDATQLISGVQAGSLKQTDVYWIQGMTAWKPLSSLGLVSAYWSGTGSLTVQQSAATSHAQPVRQAQKDGGPERCPKCDNKNVKSARHLYLIGTRDSTTTGGSIGWGKNSNPRTWVSSRTSASRLAADLAPPEKKFGCGCLLVPLALIIPVGLFASISAESGSPVAIAIMVLVGLMVGVFLCSKALKYTSEADKKAEQEYQQQIAEWERLWYCNKCSERFLW